MTMNRELLSGVVGVVVAAVLLAMGFMQEDAEAYLFPRILALVIAALAVVDLLKALRQRETAATDSGASLYPWGTIIPGLGVLVLYLALMDTLGFYAASLLGFFLMASVYRKPSASPARAWLSDLAIAVVFIGAMYVLFTVTLRVQTPRGWLF